jgi:hypothetical protein
MIQVYDSWISFGAPVILFFSKLSPRRTIRTAPELRLTVCFLGCVPPIQYEYVYSKVEGEPTISPNLTHSNNAKLLLKPDREILSGNLFGDVGNISPSLKGHRYHRGCSCPVDLRTMPWRDRLLISVRHESWRYRRLLKYQASDEKFIDSNFALFSELQKS